MAEIGPMPDAGCADASETAPPYSDEAFALAFAAEHEDFLRFVAAWGKWMVFDGKCWAPDSILEVHNYVRAICRRNANNPDRNLCRKLASGSTVAAVERLARSDPRLAATVEQWDADPWILNTPDGAIDLRGGTNWGNGEAHYATKITACGPALVNRECSRWMGFLDRITGGDVGLQQFLARLAGYCLTGSTKEHALFFLYGTGGNGKSVFINTISAIMKNYAKNAPIETFVASSFERHPTDLAGLQGARLVTAVETEEGRAWAESRIKSLTGGDKIAARFMRMDFFEYTPQFKLIIAGNHKPSLRSVDEAIRRRFYLVPFTVTIQASERDLDLGEKLKFEYRAILSWMIEGCRQWQRIGLAAPAAVTAATEAYLSSEDAIANWVAERCLTDARSSDKASSLFASWRVWAELAGEQVGTQKRFSQALEARGYRTAHTRTGSRFFGVAVAPQMTGYSND